MPIVVITGAGAGVGRDKDRPERAASDIRGRYGARALPISTDAADADAVETVADRVTPGLIDFYLAKAAYTGQLADQREPADAPASMFEPVPGDYGAHGRFDNCARSGSWETFTDRHRTAFFAAAAVGAVAVLRQVAKRLVSEHLG